MNNILISDLDRTFGIVKIHQHIGNIIQEHSTNPNLLNTVVFNGISFTEKIHIADIGCGYGRCINHLKDIITKNSEYIGIDPLESNRKTFLQTINTTNFIGKYLCGDARLISEFPDGYFDLIMCNFSLYFFIDAFPLIVKKLKSNGLFITITHSSHSLNELLNELQIVLRIDHKPTWNELGSEQILDNFNAENGLNLLQPYFNDIEIINYKNSLEFFKKDIENLLDLLNFKKTTLIHHNNYAQFIKTKDFNDELRKIILKKIDRTGKYILNKDDAIFRCRKPK